MATSSRPALRVAPERSKRQTGSPTAGALENTNRDANTVNTRRSSHAPPLLTLNDEQLATSNTRNPPKTAPRARNARKRSATAASADTSADNARPPAKVTVTQPHGELLRITNGVPQALGLHVDELPSGDSTPHENASTTGLAAPSPTPAGQTRDRRSLRSQDGGSRLKSDLATYFSNYDDIIAGVSEPADFLDLDTPIYIIDENPRQTKRQRTASPEPPQKPVTPSRSRKSSAHTPSRNPSTATAATQSSTAYQVLDYSTVSKHIYNGNTADPLADTVYFTAHRRAERKEKQLRNIEKERAMHEKQQLERLLDGLLGPDWLKVMGITGVTDGERKDWESKRDYFVKEVELLVDKFRIWKEEEKRLRAEKEAAHAAREDEDAESPTESEGTNVNGADLPAGERQQQRQREKDIQKSKQPQHPPIHQKQLGHRKQMPDEKQSQAQQRRPPRPHGYLLPLLPPEPQAPFTSFYAKPHLRAAALGKHRHGRNATAFGRPIPDFSEEEFELPEDYRTVEALRDHARKRRRQKRERDAKKTE